MERAAGEGVEIQASSQYVMTEFQVDVMDYDEMYSSEADLEEKKWKLMESAGWSCDGGVEEARQRGSNLLYAIALVP